MNNTIDYITPLDAWYHSNPGNLSWGEPTLSQAVWTISVFINDVRYANGSGVNIRAAKHDAARQAIDILNLQEDINIVVTY